jgi:hypothetical protein
MAELIPFDPSIHAPQDVGFGAPSTEYLVTIDGPDGEVIVVPSIWWNEEGKPVFLGDMETDQIYQTDILDLVKKYEDSTKERFPRFGKAGVPDNYRIADRFAQTRSKAGGASTTPLTRALDQEFSPLK